MFLSRGEVADITGYKHKEKQITALLQMGIEFNVRPRDGMPLVHPDAIKPGQHRQRVDMPDFSGV